MKTRKRQFVANVESIEERFLLSTLFTIKDLGFSPNEMAGRHTINSSAQILGKTRDSNGDHTAIFDSDGTISILQALPSSRAAIAINDLGQILVSGSFKSNVIYNGLSADYPIGGYDINNSGVIAGAIKDPLGNYTAAFYDGAIHNLCTPEETQSSAISINDSGQIAGYYYQSSDPPFSSRAFFYDGTIHDLGSFNGILGRSSASDVNSSGQVTGWATDQFNTNFAFLSDANGGNIHKIPLPPGARSSEGRSVNDKGHVIGLAQGSVGSFFYDGTTTDWLTNLVGQNSGFWAINASSINNSDQISAIGLGLDGHAHQLLLTPVPPAPVAPTITWSNPADIVYGTPISATQLNATADVPGTFTYNVAEGTVLHAGADQTLTATFTPDDTADYTTVTATAKINVNSRPVWVYANPMGNPITKVYGVTPADVTVTYLGQNHGSPFVNGDTPESLGLHVALILDTTLDSSTPVGTYEGGVYVTYNPTNGHPNDYGFGGTGIVVIVTPAPLTVTANNATKIQGQANPPLSGTIVGLVNGDTDTATYSTTATTSSPAGSYPITPTLADKNYSITYVNGILSVTNVTPVAPVVTWANPADITYGTALGPAQLNATANVLGTFTYSVPEGTVLHAGAAQVIQVTFTPDDLTHYTTATAEVSINVLKAPLTVTANNAQVRYPFQIPPLTGTITGLVNGDTDVATYTTTAVQGSWAGYYPIVPHLTDPNYNITFVNGTLTIYWSVPPIG